MNKCAKCERTVYTVEGLRCLDKIWHKGCFKCHECNMTLSLKNYKGFEKRPYCNAHCPQAKATTVADTPESRRLAENTRIQSQAKYHEDFEKSKGKGFTAIADDPETLRIKNTSKIISNVAYHGELERKKQMEEKRGLSGPDDVQNNNSGRHQNRMHHNNLPQSQDSPHPTNVYPNNGQHQPSQQQHQQLLQQQQQQQQQQQLHQKQQQQQQHNQQLLIKQQQQQIQYAQDHNGQQMLNRSGQHQEGHMHQQPSAKQIHQQQQYPVGHPHHQQMLARQQQQQQLALQQQRQSLDNQNLPINRQLSKTSISSNNSHQQQQFVKHQMIPNQQQIPQHQMKYMPMNDALVHHPSPPHLINGPHPINPNQIAGVPNGQRVAPNANLIAGPQVPHHMYHGYNQHQINNLNGQMPKQQNFVYSQPRHMIHPSQMQQINQHAMRPHNQPMQQMQHHHPQQVPRRVYRAMYDYVANDVDEVSFFENDLLVDCVNVDGNWLIGKVARSGQTGMLPANYVSEFTS